MPPKIYLVGGTIRDKLLGLSQHQDLDFAVEAASFDEMKRYLIDLRGLQVWMEREQFVTLRGKIHLRNLGGFSGYLPKPPICSDEARATIDADFTLCRRDGCYSDLRRPDTVSVGTLAEDLCRRDFTCNAIAIAENGETFDPHNGVVDTLNKTLRCVGSTKARLAEDPLRALRAIRFCVTKGMLPALELDTALCLLETALSLQTLPKERILGELRRMFAYDSLASLEILHSFPAIRKECFREIWLKPTTESF